MKSVIRIVFDIYQTRYMNRIWHLPNPGSYKSKLFKLSGPIFI